MCYFGTEKEAHGIEYEPGAMPAKMFGQQTVPLSAWRALCWGVGISCAARPSSASECAGIRLQHQSKHQVINFIYPLKMFVFSVLTAAIFAAVGSASDVVVLTSENFEKEVFKKLYQYINIFLSILLTDPGVHWRHYWRLAY